MLKIVRSPREFWSALLYLGAGLGFLLASSQYDYGTARKMGPAFFPTVLSGLLIMLGLIAFIRSFLVSGAPLAKLSLRPLLVIAGATLFFGATVKGLGFAIALPLYIVMVTAASKPFRPIPALILAVLVTAFASLVFIKALALPLPLIGPWLGA